MALCGTPPVCCGAGQDCVEGRCLAGCESGVRCGDGLEACCDAGQVCVSGACRSPGDSCGDSFDCDAGEFCEPTLDRCLPQDDPVSCTTDPVFGDFEITEEWSTTEATERPDCMDIVTAPAIIDLDGEPGGVPEIIGAFGCREGESVSEWRDGALRALDGDTGRVRWTAAEAVNARHQYATGDVDGDGVPEVVALGALEEGGGRVLLFEADGTLKWRSTAEDGVTPLLVQGENGAFALADLEGDGDVEIVHGAVVLDHDGKLVWSRDLGGLEGTNEGYGGGVSAIADIDGDGRAEVIVGRRAYEDDGTFKWDAEGGGDGYPAVAQFDEDAQPEVVVVSGGTVRIVDGLSGALEWGPIAVPGGGRGGPPTVADFDGDGRPEIGIAGASSYTVYDLDDEDGVAWSEATQDQTSNATGSSVFDFEGDGAAEVVYADECYVRVYRGSDGHVLLQIPNTSGTIHEYPLVVDVDADGNSEIVVVANRAQSIVDSCTASDPEYFDGRRGVYVYGDARDQWVRTRRIWNQHAYHVTNVTADGLIPRDEANNWEVPGLNNYRQNVQGEGVFNAPDLRPIALEVLTSGCPESLVLRARILNEGSLGVRAGVPVAFYRGGVDDRGEPVGEASTAVPLLPGATTTVEITVPIEGEGPYSFTVVVDEEAASGSVGAINECDEADNATDIGDVTCDLVF